MSPRRSLSLGLRDRADDERRARTRSDGVARDELESTCRRARSERRAAALARRVVPRARHRDAVPFAWARSGGRDSARAPAHRDEQRCFALSQHRVIWIAGALLTLSCRRSARWARAPQRSGALARTRASWFRVVRGDPDLEVRRVLVRKCCTRDRAAAVLRSAEGLSDAELGQVTASILRGLGLGAAPHFSFYDFGYSAAIAERRPRGI